MPIVNIHLWADAIEDDLAGLLIAGVTDAVVAAVGEQARESTTVFITGVPRARWGTGGSQSSKLFPIEPER